MKNFSDAKVLILSGDYKGQEGICLGRSVSRLWAVSPESSDQILNLAFERDFVLLVDLSSQPDRN